MLYFFIEIHMENQINMGDQNTQQIGQNSISQSAQIPGKPKFNYWMVSTLILAALLFGFLGWYIFSPVSKINRGDINITPTQFPPASSTNEPTDTQKQNAAVFLKLGQSNYEHDNKVFEPVKYTLVNNSSKTVYFLSGCAVVIPEVYKVQNDQKTKLQKSVIVCQALPRVNQVPSGGSVELGWNQQNLGKFVEDGQYQLEVDYSFEESGDYNIGSKLKAISDVFSVRQVTWDLNKQKQICELYGNGFHSNDFFYSKQDCLARLNE